MFLVVVGSNVFTQNLFTPDDRHTIRYAHKNRTQIPLSHIWWREVGIWKRQNLTSSKQTTTTTRTTTNTTKPATTTTSATTTTTAMSSAAMLVMVLMMNSANREKKYELGHMSWWPIAFFNELCSATVSIERVSTIIKQYCFRSTIKDIKRQVS